MLHITLPLCNARKLALRFFREEQRNNSSLHGLSAAQKSKIIKKMFRQLGASDMDALKRRAAAWEATRLGHSAPVEPKRRREVTPYELFFKEQQSNPSIASIQSPSVRERKLFAIFNSLPESTRAALEQRARERSEGITLSGGSSALVKPPLLAKTTRKPKTKKVVVKKRTSSSQAKGSSKIKAKSKGVTTKKISIKKKKDNSEKKKTSKKQEPSPYAVFVKEQMPQVKDLPIKERMKVIAEKWKSMKEKVTKVEETPVDTVVAEKQEK
ncbi:uncharacterized protein TM35_000342400 [Trypanosoma theileri]|uniref:HMG box domain-containing protein n=1 Tax=Trypanosoma theileri TaxID=67003 RepID=A0A1X0NMA4_9TRYP|nr:uncharacterized protein TM35_000342400 [Trypanosoma theileri]ORC85628.1 hypothetical protein TM35_000342400 [Trypanosoma theileri]